MGFCDGFPTVSLRLSTASLMVSQIFMGSPGSPHVFPRWISLFVISKLSDSAIEPFFPIEFWCQKGQVLKPFGTNYKV